jgi:hypothetical protein
MNKEKVSRNWHNRRRDLDRCPPLAGNPACEIGPRCIIVAQLGQVAVTFAAWMDRDRRSVISFDIISSWIPALTPAIAIE